MSDLDSVIVKALNAAHIPDPCEVSEVEEASLHGGVITVQYGGEFNANLLTQAIRDHVFEREKVANIFAEVLYDFDPHRSDKGFNLALDRLIEGLAGKVGE